MKSFPKICVVITALLSLLFTCNSKSSEFSDIRITFMLGGYEAHPFVQRIYRGARAAEQRMGCTVDYYWSDWNPDQMVMEFLAAIDSQPDAVCIMGHPGHSMLQPLVDQRPR
ncbi:MAG: hypothetical protein ACLFR1_09825 [Spirochaetia bacterium]